MYTYNLACIIYTQDVAVLSDDGSVNDAVLLAALAALKDTRLPDVSILDGEKGAAPVVRVGSAQGSPLNLTAQPLGVTIALIASEEAPPHAATRSDLPGSADMDDALIIPLTDPDAEELSLACACVFVVFDSLGDVLGLTVTNTHASGLGDGASLDATPMALSKQLLRKVVACAKDRHQELRKLL